MYLIKRLSLPTCARATLGTIVDSHRIEYNYQSKNRSKIGELEDRRKGDYAVEPEEAPARPTEIAPVHAAG